MPFTQGIVTESTKEGLVAAERDVKEAELELLEIGTINLDGVVEKAKEYY